MAARTGIFISYARRDGDAFASAFRARLAQALPGLAVWQDHGEIAGGAGWWRQIEAALERVEFLVIVMTPAVLTSEITRREWRVARQNGVAVFPVKGPGFDPAGAGVPRWMAKVHCYDLDLQWDTLVAHLRRGAMPQRVPFMAPPLPTAFVPRPRELAALKALLLSAATGDPVATTVALAGAGGFGKTTLAAAFCHDDDVLTAFDDGVLWITLGQTPNLQGELTRLHAALSGERPGFVSVEDAAQAVAEKLENRNCLIVIDDVWDQAHLKPFCRGGAGCARLVTTRQAVVAAEATRVDVDEMAPDEAVALLVARLPEAPPTLAAYRQLAHRLGEWPLLLKLAAGAMRHRIELGDSAAGALVHVGKALDRRGVTAFDVGNAADRHDAVASTIDLGLEQLAEADRLRCIQLAIFPEDVALPMAVAGELWGLDAFDTEETLARLDNASLVDFDLRRGVVGVHDVMRAYLAGRLPDGGRSAHAALLDAWGDLFRLPHGYAWRWVLHHLQGAGRQTDVDMLAGDLRWIAAQLDAAGVYAVLDDFRRASPQPETDLLAKALRLASHTLGRDPAQLAPQLLARLGEMPARLQAGLAQLLDRPRPWLRPLVASLGGPGGALVRTLDAPDAVVGLALSPAGKHLYALTQDGELLAWALHASGEGGAPTDWMPADAVGLATIADTVAGITTMVALPDGRLAVGGGRGFALWDPATGAVTDLVAIADGVSALAATADGSRLLVGSRKGELTLREAGGGSCLATLAGHRRPMSAVALSADGRIGVSGGYDKAARAWNLETGELLETLYALDEGVIYAVALSADGRLALTGAADGALRIWELPTGTLRATLAGHTHRIYALAISADGRYALSGSHDRRVKVWDLVTGELRHMLQGHADVVNAVSFTADGHYALSASKDRSVRLWRLDAGDVRLPTQQHDGWIHAVALAADGSLAVTGGQDTVLRLWDPAGCRVVDELRGHSDIVSAVALDSARGRLLSGSHDRSLRVWTLASGESYALKGPSDAVGAIALVGGGTHALTGSFDGVAFLWDLERLRIERRWDAHRRAIGFVAATAPGRVAVTGAADGTLAIWDLVRLKCFRSLQGHTDGVTAGALSSDGRYLLSGGGDGCLRLWAFPRCTVLTSVDAHRGRVRSIQILAAAGLALSTGYDGYVKVWRFPAMTPVAAFAADSAVAAAAASADGRLIVAGDAQGCAHFLRLEGMPADR